MAPAARTAVEGHVRLLLAWNPAINLTAARDPLELCRRHVLDSLAAVPELRRLGVRAFVDMGSGGGFPGIPLAAALATERALLVESIRKKAAFLETAVSATDLARTVEVAPTRVEDVADDPRHRERWPAVLARAVASLPDLVELAFPLLARGGSLVAWKSDGDDEELAAGRRAVEGLGGGRIRVVGGVSPDRPDHRLVVVTKRGATGSAYPRQPAARARRPW